MEIPPILVINLKDREDRWIEHQKAYKEWSVSMERVNAVKMKPGWKGCSLSHRKCIEIAKKRKYPWVIILEDDAIPMEGSMEQLRTLLPTLWALRDQWDIFNGGPSYIFDAQVLLTEPPLYRIKAYATQFCLVHEGVYDKILNDVDGSHKIDVYYKDNLRMICTAPHISIQNTGYSDIENKEIDYHRYFNNSNEILKAKHFLHQWEFVPQSVGAVLVILAAVAVGMVVKRKIR